MSIEALVELVAEYWIYLSVAGSILLLSLLLGVFALRKSQANPLRALQAVALDSLRNIVLPDGMDGDIHIERLLLTARGFVVLDVKAFEGIIFAGDLMDDWTVMAKDRRYTFPNPQRSLYDRMAAVRRLVEDSPVAGYVLFPSGADFTKGRPKHVILPEELAADYAKPEAEAIAVIAEELAPHWQRLQAAAEPAPFNTD